jgi:BASS family bile acid:Na+ symporter
MSVVGLALTPADFRRVAESPRAAIGGTLAQIALLPPMTLLVVWLLELPPVFGAGAVLVAVSPGAGISNILTALAGANTALSVTLTGIASLLSVVTLPVIAAAGLRWFTDGAVDVDVPVASLVLQLTVSLLIPIALGMWVRLRWPEFALRSAPALQRAAFAAIALLVTLAVVFGEDEQQLTFRDAEAGLVGAGVWTLAAMAIGWGVAALLRLPSDDRFTLLIEFSARNITVATIVAISGLGRVDLSLFSAAYLVVGYPLCALAVVWRRRLRRPGAPPAAAPTGGAPAGRNDPG